METLKQMLSPMVYDDQRVVTGTLSKNELRIMERIREAKINILEGILRPEEAVFVRPEILASWQRSYRYGLNLYDYNYAPQLTNSEFEKLLHEKGILLKAADPYICELETMLLNSKSIILLTDEQGVMLRVIDGDTGLLAEQNRRFQLGLGSVWSERTVGTCGHTLSIELKIPIQVCGPEHYCEKHEQIACSSAPIFDIDNTLAGTLSIVTPSFRDQNPHTLALVRNMASAIQHEFQYQLTKELLRVAFENSDEAVITINNRGNVVSANTKAIAEFNLADQDINTIQIEKLIGKHSIIKSILTSNAPACDVDIKIDVGERKLVLSEIRTVKSESGINLGYVLLFVQDKKGRKSGDAKQKARKKSAFDKIIGSSPQLKKTIQMAKTFACLEDPILIHGESGTGKEVFAKAIHEVSRPNGPLIAVNCAAIPRTLIESELFGYRGGAFTGAERQGRPGKIELADGGTLFLDEIGDMPLEVQPVLLRVLEEKQVFRIGASEPIPVNFRLIAATNKNLEELVKQNKFREDLYFRLAVFKLDIAPLRERKSDINDLLNYFMREFARKQKMQVPVLSSAVKCLLYQYDWPGNVRQLKNTVKYAMAMSKKGVIRLEDLPDTILQSADCLSLDETDETAHNKSLIESPKQLNEMEKEAIQNALIANEYNISQTAKSLGVSRSTLYRKMREYGVTVDRKGCKQ